MILALLRARATQLERLETATRSATFRPFTTKENGKWTRGTPYAVCTEDVIVPVSVATHWLPMACAILVVRERQMVRFNRQGVPEYEYIFTAWRADIVFEEGRKVPVWSYGFLFREECE